MVMFWVFVLLLMATSASADSHYYDFIVTRKNFTRLCATKSMLVVNGSFPGPTVVVHKGDTLYVNVYNHADDGLTIHWHGVKQPRNPWYDGPEYVTQCSIQSGTNFTYKVIFSDEEGTLWWHAHSDWTRASVHGAIKILPANGTTFPFPEPDGDEVLVLGSWYTEDYLNEVVTEDLETGDDLPDSDSFTLNGQPGDFVECSQNSTYRWQVDYGKTYLLRIVSAVVDEELFLAVAEHNLTVVGVDGRYVKPIETGYIVISPGQTIDVLLTANQSLGRYYIGGRKYYSQGFYNITFDDVNVTSILEYRGNYSFSSPPIFPSQLPNYYGLTYALDFTNRLRSIGPVSVPLNISTKMFIAASMNEIYCANITCGGLDGNKLGTSLNNISWANPDTDILRAYYRNVSGVYESDFPDHPATFYNFTGDDLPDSTLFPSQATKVKVLNYNETVEIVFQGTNVLGGSVNHPMHMHGYGFYVIGVGLGNFDNETDPLNYNLVDPPKVTTWSVPRNGWIAIRFQASNPGVWLWHCHLDRHMTWGMDTVFIVKDGGTAETSILPMPAYMPSCEESLKSKIKKVGSKGRAPEVILT